MIGGFDDDEFLGLGSGGEHGFELRFRTELIAGTADEDLRFRALLQKREIVTAIFKRSEGRSESSDCSDPRIGTGRLQPDRSAKRKSREDDRQLEFAVEPVERRADVFDLADAVIVRTLAKAGTSEIETENRDA